MLKPLPRLGAAACGALLCTALQAGVAAAQTDFPNRPIRVIVPLAPGGGSDYTARYIGQRLADRVGQAVVVDNRPAASGIVGTELVARAVPDGYTLLLAYSTHAQSAQLFTTLPYDPIRDFAPVTEVIATPLGLILNPAVPAKSVQELVAYAKANPGKLNYGSSGPGSSPHLAMELLNSMSGMKMTHIPYKGVGLYMTAQIGNEIQVTFSNMFTTMPHWKAGRLRLVASGGVKRSEAFPDLPTIAESGVPGYNVTGWYGFYAPAGTPPEIVRRLQAEAARALTSGEVRERLVKAGNDPVVSTPEAFEAFVRVEIAKWSKVVREARLTLE